MIKVQVFRNKNNEIVKVDVSGHSGYDDIGKDIVCSSVSSAMYLTIGLIQKINPNHKYTENNQNAQMILEITQNESITNIIMNNLIEFLESIEQDYSKFLKIINKN